MADLADKKDIAVRSEGVRLLEWTYDFANDGGAVGKLDVAVACEKVIIHRAWLKVDTLFTSAGAPTLSIGHSGSTVAVIIPVTALGALVDDAVLAETATPLNVVMDVDDIVQIDILVAAYTAGKATLVLELSQLEEG